MTATIDHPTDRPNYSVVTIGALTYCFSYSTCVAFHHPDTGFVARRNDWGPTTGKHLNAFCPEGTHRHEPDAFADRLALAEAAR